MATKPKAQMDKAKRTPYPKAEFEFTLPTVHLPTKPNAPPTNLSSYCLCIYGEKGVGKSSLAAAFPKALSLMYEPRRRNLKIRQVPNYTKRELPLTWPTTIAYVEKIIKDPKVETVVIDTVDRFYQVAFDFYVAAFRELLGPVIKDLSDIKYGKGWSIFKAEVNKVVDALLFSDKVVIFISHSKQREDKDSLGNEITVIEPSCPPSCITNILKPTVDFAFYYGYYQRERVMIVRGQGEYWTACGVDDHFLDSNGDRIDMFNVGDDSPQESYKNLLAAFDNKLDDSWLHLLPERDEDEEEE